MKYHLFILLMHIMIFILLYMLFLLLTSKFIYLFISRLCDVLCCDDCSKRRTVVDASQVRTCDTCYNRTACIAEKAEHRTSLQVDSSSSSSLRPQLLIGSTPTKTKKQELFGNAPSAAQQDHKVKQGSAAGLSATMSTMSEAHERLLERGEKLNKLSDKTADMANSANEFSKMAKQLHEQQKNRWF